MFLWYFLLVYDIRIIILQFLYRILSIWIVCINQIYLVQWDCPSIIILVWMYNRICTCSLTGEFCCTRVFKYLSDTGNSWKLLDMKMHSKQYFFLPIDLLKILSWCEVYITGADHCVNFCVNIFLDVGISGEKVQRPC